MTLRLAGIGTALPEHAIRQQDAAEAAKAFCVVGADQQRLMSVPLLPIAWQADTALSLWPPAKG